MILQFSFLVERELYIFLEGLSGRYCTEKSAIDLQGKFHEAILA